MSAQGNPGEAPVPIEYPQMGNGFTHDAIDQSLYIPGIGLGSALVATTIAGGLAYYENSNLGEATHFDHAVTGYLEQHPGAATEPNSMSVHMPLTHQTITGSGDEVVSSLRDLEHTYNADLHGFLVGAGVFGAGALAWNLVIQHRLIKLAGGYRAAARLFVDAYRQNATS